MECTPKHVIKVTVTETWDMQRKIQHEKATFQLRSCSKCCSLAQTRVFSLRRHWSRLVDDQSINQSIIFYFHLKNQTRYSAIAYRFIEMVGCQKSKCSSSWPPIIRLHLHALLICKHLYPHSHKQTVNQQYKQLKGSNNIIMHHARKLQQLQIYSSLLQSNNNNESIRRRCASVQPWRRWGAALITIFI